MREMQEFDKTPIGQVREFVIDQLKINYAHDNLVENEFESRLVKANEVDQKQELLALVSDLPRLEENGSKELALGASGVTINRGSVRETDNMVAVLGGTTRKGLWKPARSTRIVSILGSTDLDFTEAEMPPGVMEIEIFSLLGGADIKVPPGIRVETDVIPVLGGVDNKTESPTDPNSPTIRIRGFAILGGVDIKTKKKKTRRR
jgi:hypothetical protein